MQAAAVLMAHVLPLPNLLLEELAAASPFPTAAAQINGSGLFNVSVTEVRRCARRRALATMERARAV